MSKHRSLEYKPDYPPFNPEVPKSPESKDKAAKGKWHYENAVKQKKFNSVLYTGFHEAKKRGFTDEQAYEYVKDLALAKGWSHLTYPDMLRNGKRTFTPINKLSSNTSTNVNRNPVYVEDPNNLMSEKEYVDAVQRQKNAEAIREAQGKDSGIIYSPVERSRMEQQRNRPGNNGILNPKEVKVTMDGLHYLNYVDPTGLTGIPEVLESGAAYAAGKGSGADFALNVFGSLPAIGKLGRYERGLDGVMRNVGFSNSLVDTGEELIGRGISRVAPPVGNVINRATEAVQDFTVKPGIAFTRQGIRKQLQRGNYDLAPINRRVDAWNGFANTVNTGRAADDVVDLVNDSRAAIKKAFDKYDEDDRKQYKFGGGIRNRLFQDIMQFAWKGNPIQSRKLYNRLKTDNEEKNKELFNRLYGGVPQYAYLSSPKEFDRQMLENGYVRENNKDYGLVKHAVGDKNIPIYKKGKNEADRKDLVPIANPYSSWFGPDKTGLYHAGSYPTTLYVNGKTGDLYQKAWDLNDYGGNSGTAQRRSWFGKLEANVLDVLGNPSVVTTGYTKVNPHRLVLNKDYTEKPVSAYYDDYLKKKGLKRTVVDGKHIITLPEVTITSKR